MTIYFGPWQSYPWKNELAEQSKRVAMHYAERVSEDFEGQHSPHDMLDRALVLSGFAIRRLVEKRLVTDRLRAEKFVVRTFSSKNGGEFRRPFLYESGGSVFDNYHFEKPETKRLKLGDIANEIIHASQLMFARNDDKVPDGLLIASDWYMKDRLLHLTINEFTELVKRVLDDRVRFGSDSRDDDTGAVHAVRR
jgi:hypothetical protein